MSLFQILCLWYNSLTNIDPFNDWKLQILTDIILHMQFFRLNLHDIALLSSCTDAINKTRLKWKFPYLKGSRKFAKKWGCQSSLLKMKDSHGIWKNQMIITISAGYDKAIVATMLLLIFSFKEDANVGLCAVKIVVINACN